MKKLIIALSLLLAAIGPIALIPHVIADNSAPKTGPAPILASFYGGYDYAFEGVGAWVGRALVQVGTAPAKPATFVDRNNTFGQRANGMIYGTETLSVTFTDGSGGFDVRAQFVGTSGSTPGMYYLHETGRITNGTGAYANASGSVSVEGPFMFPDPSVTPGVPSWMGELRGEVEGVLGL